VIGSNGFMCPVVLVINRWTPGYTQLSLRRPVSRIVNPYPAPNWVVVPVLLSIIPGYICNLPILCVIAKYESIRTDVSRNETRVVCIKVNSMLEQRKYILGATKIIPRYLNESQHH
jgi:hypothetical protein